MSQKASAERHAYLYGIVGSNGNGAKKEPTGPNLGPIGIDGSEVYGVRVGPATAVISGVTDRRIRPQRRNLAAHQEVLKSLMKDRDVLPITFGTIAEDDGAVAALLSQHRDTISQQLERVAGKFEMGLRVTWDVDNIFEYFVNTHKELKRARDGLVGRGRESTQEERIELGRLFDSLLSEERSSLADKVEKVLSRCSSEIRRNNCRNEREVMNLACLIGRDQEKRFEAGVLEAAALFDDSYAFDYSGPWAPHNFVDVNLQA